ncbi:MAG: hypothetical protein K8M05_11505 [Deltaproteobacteria bacterium]|nr:hypothetical protein [Kofleriaceae bacterium]
MLEATTRTVPDSSRRFSLYAGAWLAFGAALAFGGALRAIPQAGPAFVLASAVAWSIAYVRSDDVRRWAGALPMRALVAFHAIRLPIGALFLWEASHGRVPQLFADRAGWGDMAAGAAAIAVAIAGWQRPRVVRAFAIFGLADILVALGTAMYLLFVVNDPLTFEAITRLPYPLLPLAVVPVVVVTHLLMIVTGGAAYATRPAAR